MQTFIFGIVSHQFCGRVCFAEHKGPSVVYDQWRLSCHCAGCTVDRTVRSAT